MTDRSTAVRRLSIAWQSELEVLEYWGHEDQGRTLALCRERLERHTEDGEGGEERFASLLAAWESDAAVLEAFGHADEAGALRRCVERLAAASGVGARAGLTVVRSVSPPPSRPDPREAAVDAGSPSRAASRGSRS